MVPTRPILQVLSLVASSAVLAFGCQSADKPTPGKNTAGGDAEFRVALLTPGPVNDSGWSAIAYDGLLGIQEVLGARINNVVAVTPQEIKDNLRSYAQEGFDLIIGHGFEYNQHNMEIAPDFPKTVFVSSSGSETAPNVGTFRFYLEQAMYVAGVVAGRMTKSNVVGMVGGPEVPSIDSTFDAFEQGVHAVNPNCKVLRAYTGSGEDVGAAKQQSLAFIDQGADFLVHQANAAAQGVFEACKERGIYAIGTNSDQASAAPDTVLLSAVIVARPAFIKLAEDVRNGEYKGEIRLTGLSDGAVDVRWNETLKAKVPADVLQAAEETMEKIRSGELVVKKREF
ncbi:MAG: Purine-binding protein [Fimbriimonadales bacterium]|nr:Purine-binding protein [Fimbriimonadales bacterium]